MRVNSPHRRKFHIFARSHLSNSYFTIRPLWARIFAATAGALIGWWAFLPPHMQFFPVTAGQELSIMLFGFTVLCVVGMADHYRRATSKLRGEEKLRKLAVDELAHRLKNKIATIQAVVAVRLREHPEVQTEVLGSLKALSAADDLIAATQGSGAYIRDLIRAEVAPYKAEDRAVLTGPDVLLPPKLALTMALLVHELATNAAKYGALSSSAGKVAVQWAIDRGHLQVFWRERGGPTVTPPNRRGFGTRLFARALEPFGGTADVEFSPTGLVCSLMVPMSELSPNVLAAKATAALEEVAAAGAQPLGQGLGSGEAPNI